MPTIEYAPPVGPQSRHLLPGSDYYSEVTGEKDPDRAGPHAGLDFQPKVRGAAEPIDWLVSGTITRIVRTMVQGSTTHTGYAWHTGNFVEWSGLDGILWHYRHMSKSSMTHLRVGQRVEVGDHATFMGTTGKSNGVHLHLGARINGRFVDPEPILRDNGAWPIGWTPGQAVQAPVITPAATPQHVLTEAQIRQICIRAGHGDSKTSTGLLIERYQHRQLAPFQLVHDRHWGKRTNDHYQWVLRLQRAMNSWAGNKIAEDGDYRAVTKNRVIDLQRRNRTGAYYRAGGRVVDGLPEAAFCRMLGIPTHP